MPSKPEGGFRLTSQLICLVLAGFIAGNSTLLALVANLSEMEGGHEESSARWWIQTGLLIATFVVAALLGPQLAKGLIANWRRRRLSVDLLFLLGCVGAMWFSLRSYWSGQGAVYFEVVSILLFIYCLGSWIKGVTQQRIWTTLDAWSPEHHRCQLLGDSGGLSWVTVSVIKRGDQVQIAAGSMVPIDGVVTRGEAFLRTSTMTGEPHVSAVKLGDEVLASSIVVDAPIVVRATVSGNGRMIDRLTQSVVEAAKTPSRWETQADIVARFFTPVVAGVALLTFLIWWGLGDASVALMNALAVLLVACPCAFGFATPVSIWVTLSRLAKRSLLIRRNDVVERLAAVDIVVFDKTGTLTTVEPRLLGLYLSTGMGRINGESGLSKLDVLQLARSLEAGSNHPIATAFTGDLSPEIGVESMDIALLPVIDFESIPAVGVRGRVSHQGRLIEVTVGRFERIDSATAGGLVSLNDPWQEVKNEARQHGHQLIGVKVDEVMAAVALVGESAIDTLERGLARLEAMELQVELLSGDQSERVDRIGIEASSSGLNPTEKQQRCETLTQLGRKVLFVGDGTNDAAAMGVSHASIATAGGASLALEAADLVWYGRDLESVADGISICRDSVATLRWTLRFAVLYNSLGMLVAATGWLHPVFAVVLMLGSSLTVVLRAAR